MLFSLAIKLIWGQVRGYPSRELTPGVSERCKLAFSVSACAGASMGGAALPLPRLPLLDRPRPPSGLVAMRGGREYGGSAVLWHGATSSHPNRTSVGGRAGGGLEWNPSTACSSSWLNCTHCGQWVM
jgi:hypothetical protein